MPSSIDPNSPPIYTSDYINLFFVSVCKQGRMPQVLAADEKNTTVWMHMSTESCQKTL